LLNAAEEFNSACSITTESTPPDTARITLIPLSYRVIKRQRQTF